MTNQTRSGTCSSRADPVIRDPWELPRQPREKRKSSKPADAKFEAGAGAHHLLFPAAPETREIYTRRVRSPVDATCPSLEWPRRFFPGRRTDASPEKADLFHRKQKNHVTEEACWQLALLPSKKKKPIFLVHQWRKEKVTRSLHLLHPSHAAFPLCGCHSYRGGRRRI